DISKSIASEMALAENEARFRSFIEQSSDGIVLINETGNIILWNKGMESISGIGSTEVMNLPVWEIMTNIATESRKNIPGAKEQLKQRMLNLLAGKEQQWIG
ncbi:PAS domain S-box protein, partial [Arthrospira platensis SPKY1]|nr:PAS domain S-box protein [Arthrospira platensis SPKY1]